jgi:D-beta-D-heptose 7-phosphate kinase/D-beta-D-heptose 1-phosphate adenosyltransferase
MPDLNEAHLSYTRLAEILQTKREQGQKVVFTNGCFDILHAGHVSYLAEAAALGDVLVVGLNSDASVKRLKGQSRPINNQQDRAKVLLALRAVDYVVIFEEDTPLELIKAIQPDVLVKGGDWQPKEIVGADIVLANNGIVQSLSFSPGLSSSAIIAKILEDK